MAQSLLHAGDVRGAEAVTPGHWGEIVGGVYAPVHVRETDRSFSGHLRNVDIGGVNVSRVQVGKHRLQRLASEISANDVPKVVLCAQVSGHGAITQNGRQAILGPGDLTVYDTSSPFELEFDGTADCVGMVVPWGNLAPSPEVSRLLAGTFMSGADPVVRTVSSVIIASEAGLGDMPFGARRRFAQHMVQVFETLCWSRLVDEDSRRDGDAPERARLAPILLFIEENLADPELNMRMLAARSFLSVRALQDVARKSGISLPAWIRTRRLEKCRADLTQFPELLVSRIAAQHGFSGPSHFNQLFRERFGMSPGAYRSAVRDEK